MTDLRPGGGALPEERQQKTLSPQTSRVPNKNFLFQHLTKNNFI